MAAYVQQIGPGTYKIKVGLMKQNTIRGIAKKHNIHNNVSANYEELLESFN